MTIVADIPAHVDALEVTVGVDTYADTHVAAVIDPLGRHLGHDTFDTTAAGFKALLAWAATFGSITVAGVEGTGAYGAGLARFLTTEDVTVVEVDGPTARPAATRASPTPSTPTPRRVLLGPGGHREPPRHAPVTSNRSGCCAWPATAPSGPEPKR